MRHDPRLRAAARAIYGAVYPSDDWSPVGFEEAERCGTVHYRQAVDAAQRAHGVLGRPASSSPSRSSRAEDRTVA